MDKLLETHIIEKLAQEEIENWNSPLSIKDLKLKLKKKVKFYQSFKDEIILIVHNCFIKHEKHIATRFMSPALP